MNDNNDFSSPPNNFQQPNGNPNFQPQQPNGNPPANIAPPAPIGGLPPSGVKRFSKATIGTMIILGAIILIVPMGLFKIGSPSPCDSHRQKLGECKIVATPSSCTPKRFNEESEYLTCKMLGAFNNKFQELHPSKYDACMSLKKMIAVAENKEEFKCYAPMALLKMKAGKGKVANPAEISPLEVQKLSVLNALSSGALTADFIFTIIIISILLFIMAFAAYTAHKKNRDSYIYVVSIYIIGLFAAYIYRYYAAGFYQSNIVVLIMALIGVIPLVAIIASKAGRLGLSMGNDNMATGNYTIQPEVQQEPLPTEPLSPAEMTKFEKMGLQKTSFFQAAFIITFISLVLMLIPVGLMSMGKSSEADSSMKKEAVKMTSLTKKQSNETTEDIDMGEEEPDDM